MSILKCAACQREVDTDKEELYLSSWDEEICLECVTAESDLLDEDEDE